MRSYSTYRSAAQRDQNFIMNSVFKENAWIFCLYQILLYILKGSSINHIENGLVDFWSPQSYPFLCGPWFMIVHVPLCALIQCREFEWNVRQANILLVFCKNSVHCQPISILFNMVYGVIWLLRMSIFPLEFPNWKF